MPKPTPTPPSPAAVRIAHDEPPFTEAAYYLRKRGLYYRPKAAGYTASQMEAGLFSYAYAFADQQATAGEKDPMDRVEMSLARYAIAHPAAVPAGLPAIDEILRQETYLNAAGRQQLAQRIAALWFSTRANAAPDLAGAAERAAEEVSAYKWASGKQAVEDIAAIITKHLAALGSDGERLDWWEANSDRFGMKCISINGVKEWWYSQSRDGWKQHGPFKTFRATVDSARDAAGREGV